MCADISSPCYEVASGRLLRRAIIENFQSSLAHNSCFDLFEITSNLVQTHIVWSCTTCQNLGQIDHNLHSHVIDDVICKSPIPDTRFHVAIRRAKKVFLKYGLGSTTRLDMLRQCLLVKKQ